jgi:hypothetical protein
LYDDTGLATTRKCDLLEAFQKYARYNGDALIFADKNATKLAHKPGGIEDGPGARPEIDRERLKQILLDSVPKEIVRWGFHLREVTENGMLSFMGGRIWRALLIWLWVRKGHGARLEEVERVGTHLCCR